MSLIVDLTGLEITAEEHTILENSSVSGVILFTRNVDSREQVKQLTQSIRDIRPDLVIMADHEGGYVQRIQRRGFFALPAAQVYGDFYNTNPEAGLALAEQYGQQMAEDLLSVGIDLSLAPVLDVIGKSSIIGGLCRAFHEDPEVVSQIGDAFIRGMHAAGMPSVGKHFPGHGSCEADSHLALPCDERSLAEITAHDLVPFRNLIASGQLNAVMPAHILFPKVDPLHATGYSEHWLKLILRSQLGFKGFIMSDCLGMAGADIGPLPTRVTQALRAGCNGVIVANQPRNELLNLLAELSTEFNTTNHTYLDEFKQHMRRFMPGTPAPFDNPMDRYQRNKDEKAEKVQVTASANTTHTI
jgi:beta-N-acetylhexosaminidase